MKQITTLINRYPLRSILFVALIPRLIAAVFSQGYGMHDDHFGPIEQPHIILHDSSYWTERTTPHGHSIVYPAIHYGLLLVIKTIGIDDPKFQMFIIRVIHALYSLLIVYFGYRIAQQYSSQQTAVRTGLILALFWPLPFISVRNLIEVVCIPPLMGGMYYALKNDKESKYALWSGVLFALSFIVRYQTVIIPAVIVLIWLIQKKYKSVVLISVGGFFTALLIQGTADLLAWGYPFAAVIEYIQYNATHSTDYTTGEWYRYLLLLAGAFIPPVSFFLLYGFVKNWKKNYLLFFPTLAFFIFLSLFPNKQERFVFSVVPQILLFSSIGWIDSVSVSSFWQRHKKYIRVLWLWFWVLNTILLLIFSTYYSKRARVEAMYYFYGKPVNGYLLVAGDVGITQLPQFYSGQYTKKIYEIHKLGDIPPVMQQIEKEKNMPNYAILHGPQAVQEKLPVIEEILGRKFTYEATVEPSFLDYVFYRLNPRYNKNQTIYIYRIE